MITISWHLLMLIVIIAGLWIFTFPTEEMRDAFKENFDPDIEICKELL